MTLPTLSKQTVRRFVLGRQGLWPGRRWQGKAGTAEAIRRCEAVQIDPLNIVARSHDITLWSRVADYQPEYLPSLCYDDRAFFDYGGTLMIYPMDELPYWRVVMQRKGAEGRWASFAAEHGHLIDEVRATLRARGPLGNRDFEGRTRVSSYYARKDTGLALRYLWLTGELMTYHRRGFERLFHFREHVVPPSHDGEATVEEAEHFFARKAFAWLGMARARGWASMFAGLIERPVARAEAQQRLDDLLAAGEVVMVNAESYKEPLFVLADDVPLLQTVADGQVPDAWQPLNTTTEDEAVFLAPLDIVSARGRAKVLFDFDYIWEVYKPAAIRRWGYYTLPILYGDQLVARLDPALDRTSATLKVNGFWLEEGFPADEAFAQALARGLAHFGRFVGARRLDLATLHPAPLQEHVQAMLVHEFDLEGTVDFISAETAGTRERPTM
jgi:uncharacterized protein YcaQ